MKKWIIILFFGFFLFPLWAQNENGVENRIELSFYASTLGEMQINVVPQWKFPALQGDHPLFAENNINVKLDFALSPIWAGMSGNAELTVFPFLLFTVGGSAGTGWNYELAGEIPLIGLGINKRKNADDKNDGVIGNGFDGIAWDLHVGSMLQIDLAAFFPGDWNHIIAQVYNEVQYFAYTKADDNEFWYYLCDDGLNRNAFRHKFTAFVGYMMPIFVDLVGIQLEGILPFYNNEIGSDITDIAYSFTNSFIANFKINKTWSIMTIACLKNGFKDPITSSYERKWEFDRVQFIATWQMK
jgi:hypothetical protein